MMHLFVLAGIPEKYEKLIDGPTRKKIASERGKLLVEPLPVGLESPIYNADYRTELLEQCCDWVDERGLDEPYSISLLYAESKGVRVQNLIEDFFPFSLLAPFPAPPVVATGNERRYEVNRLVNMLVPICTNLRTRTKIIHDHLTSRARRTPLLLPPQNFGSQNLDDALRTLQAQAVHKNPLEPFINRIIDQIERTVERQRSGGRSHYVNEAGLVFTAPSRTEFHAHARRPEFGDEHQHTCFLRGRSRLGGSYNPRFHYDCHSVHGQLGAEYISCHGQSFRPPRSTHVNIAPNDNVR